MISRHGIDWPGQACAHKVGELRILDLHRHTGTELGEAFDIRAFHDVSLGAGPVTLDIMEERVERWIASHRPTRPSSGRARR